MMRTARTIPEAAGYAVVDNGKIDVSSVSPARRAAMVNFLVTARDTPIFAKDSDSFIEEAWRELAAGAEVVRVKIAVVARAPIRAPEQEDTK